MRGIDGAPRQYVTAADLPTTDAAEANVAEAREGLEAAQGDRRSLVAKVGLVGAGAAAVGGAMLLAAARTGGLGGALGIAGGTIAGAAAIITPIAFIDIYTGHGPVSTAETVLGHAEERRDEIQIARDRGADFYNTVASTIIGRYDHDLSGTINVRPDQELGADERIRLTDGGPARELHDHVRDMYYYFENADTNADGEMDGAEIATRFMRVSADWQRGDLRDAFEQHDPGPLESVGAGRRSASDALEVWNRDAATS